MRRRTRRWTLGIGALPVLVIGLALPTMAPAATADLAVQAVDNPDPVTEGADITYTVTASNLGPETASGVVVRATLSSKVTFRSADAPQGTCEASGRTVQCALGQLPVGDETVTIRASAKKAGQVSFSTRVGLSKADTDPVSTNDRDTETTTVTAPGGGGGGGPTCAGRPATIVGTGAPEVLTGTPQVDVIKARGGGDVIRAFQGRDIVCAGGGGDVIRGGGGNDLLKGGARRDLLKGGGGNDYLRGGPGRDRCRGGGGRDSKRSC